MKSLINFFIENWFFDTQSTFYVIVKGLKNAYGGTSLLQMIIRSGRPLANDHPVAGWKLPFSCVKSVWQHIGTLFVTTKKNYETLTVRCVGGGSTLTVSLTVKYPFLRLPYRWLEKCQLSLWKFSVIPWPFYIVSHMQMLVEPFKFSLVSLNGRAEDYRQAARTLEMLHFFTEPLNFSIMQDLEQRSDIFLILFLNFSIMQC